MAFLMDLTQIIWKRADTYEIKNGFGVDNQEIHGNQQNKGR
jgi:hypothetical protein